MERRPGGFAELFADVRTRSAVKNIQLRDGSEFDLVRRMLTRWGNLAEGIGDDGVLLDLSSNKTLVVSTDASVENVHFRREWLEPREIGYRATAAALSDLAAMAATPSGILLALTLPDTWRQSIDHVADGIGEAVAFASTRIVGGDLSEGRDLAIVVTVLGNADRPLTRASAKPGDRVYVTGRLGGPGAALSALLDGNEPSRENRMRFAHPVPRIGEAQWLAANGVVSGTDISDGLAADLANIAVASGVSISLSLERIPAMANISPRDAAGSGEEYELVVTSPRALDARAFENEFGILLTEVGHVEAGRPVVRVFDYGAPVPTPAGYSHFA
jgi:thiamine-monophosphate kinase